MWELTHPDLSSFGGLRTAPGVGHNLPAAPTPLIGRRAELTELAWLLGDRRLVTITGAGGVGKSRLAQHAAGGRLADFPGGVFWVDLATLDDGERLASTVAAVVGVTEAPGEPVEDLVLARLAPARALVVLDNCEHLLGAVAGLVDQILARCSGVTLLATSREPLGARGETTWRAPSLAVPPRVAGADRAPGGLRVGPAVRGAGPAGPAQLRPGRAQWSGGPPDLPPSRRHPARHRAGRRPGAHAGSRAPGRGSRPPLPPAHRRRPHRPGPPAHAAGLGRLELRPPRRPRAGRARDGWRRSSAASPWTRRSGWPPATASTPWTFSTCCRGWWTRAWSTWTRPGAATACWRPSATTRSSAPGPRSWPPPVTATWPGASTWCAGRTSATAHPRWRWRRASRPTTPTWSPPWTGRWAVSRRWSCWPASAWCGCGARGPPTACCGWTGCWNTWSPAAARGCGPSPTSPARWAWRELRWRAPTPCCRRPGMPRSAPGMPGPRRA